jgi:hypothetical protein
VQCGEGDEKQGSVEGDGVLHGYFYNPLAVSEGEFST